MHFVSSSEDASCRDENNEDIMKKRRRNFGVCISQKYEMTDKKESIAKLLIKILRIKNCYVINKSLSEN